jgi:hypothetical protein
MPVIVGLIVITVYGVHEEEINISSPVNTGSIMRMQRPRCGEDDSLDAAWPHTRASGVIPSVFQLIRVYFTGGKNPQQPPGQPMAHTREPGFPLTRLTDDPDTRIPPAAKLGVYSMANGARPSRPNHHGTSDRIWRMVERCWHTVPSKRMSTEEVVGLLEAELRQGVDSGT